MASSLVPFDERLAGMRAAASRAAILLDFDGTLSPIVERPELARMEPGIREALGALAPTYALVAVVSGRPDAEVASLVGVDGVRIAGLYGLGDGAGLASLPDDIVRAVTRVCEVIPGSSVEPKGGTIALHLRGTADPDAAQADAAAMLAPLAAASGLRVLSGKRVLELVPLGADLKDAAVRRMLTGVDVDAALYAGDDIADLAAFEALDLAGIAGLKIAVRGPETPPEVVAAADLVLEGPEEMLGLLRAMVP